MILADTSVWINFFRTGDPSFREMLEAGYVVMHDFVLGELACGNLQDRNENLVRFAQLPRAATATQEEVLFFIREKKLHHRGMGWIDMHLLASASLGRLRLYTRDSALRRAAEELGVSYDRAFSAMLASSRLG
jgi:predicted nucleic acid-binding protein